MPQHKAVKSWYEAKSVWHSAGDSWWHELISATDMKLLWFLALVCALVAMVAGQNCPAKFKLDANKLCTAERPIHGECPSGSIYNLNLNKCVHVAKG